MSNAPGTTTSPPPPARATTPPAISVRDLRKSYGDVEAVRGVDLDVRTGEILALLGPNGAGKTTIIEILEGFREATSGVVAVLGADPASGERRDRVGVVLQESQPEIDLTVRECLQLYAGYYRAPRPIEETMALVGLEEHGAQQASTLSGGQRRRLDVALALIGDPDLLFLDEPTTGFDPAARRAAWEVISGLRALGKTIVLTTHYMEEAERLADRIVVMAKGRVVADGTPTTLGGRHRARATISFALPDGFRVEDLPRPADLDDHGIVTVHADRPTADLYDLAFWALARGLELDGLEVRHPTLEDVYLELTR